LIDTNFKDPWLTEKIDYFLSELALQKPEAAIIYMKLLTSPADFLERLSNFLIGSNLVSELFGLETASPIASDFEEIRQMLTIEQVYEELALIVSNRYLSDKSNFIIPIQLLYQCG